MTVAGAEPYLLPFAVSEREGGTVEEFPFEMMLATVLADVEKRRVKTGLLRTRREALESASLLYWPIVITPWKEDRHLVFDGMGVWSHVFSQGLLPDIRSFIEALDAATDYVSLRKLLQARATMFDAFDDTERVPVMGLFIHEEFMKDVLSHHALGKPEGLQGTPVLAPRLTLGQVDEAVERMQALVDASSQDLQTLAKVGKALARSLDRGRKDLASRREHAEVTSAKRVESIRPDVDGRVAALEKEREQRWGAMQPKLLDLQARLRKAEADVAHWSAESQRTDDPTAAAHAQERGEAASRERDDLTMQVRAYQGEMAQVRQNYDRQVQSQWDRIRTLERERDAELARLNEEEQSLVDLTSKFGLAIGGLSKQLEQSLWDLKSQGVQAAVAGRTIVHMPIMVASFLSGRGRRFVVYPPMVARTGRGVLGALKVTLGGAVLPLEPKTERFEGIFRDGIERALSEDASLAAHLASVGNANNLLHLRNLKGLLARGLADLKAQGWIKDKRQRELIQSLERHIAAAARTAPPGGPKARS